MEETKRGNIRLQNSECGIQKRTRVSARDFQKEVHEWFIPRPALYSICRLVLRGHRTQGFKFFKDVLSFLPLVAGKQSYIRTTHSL